MLRSRKLNDKIKKLNERYLAFTYEDHKTLFEELLDFSFINSVSFQYKNLQCLVIELCQVFVASL